MSDRHYLVGQNCLAWLLETELVAKARYRHSAEVAYRREMEMRRNGAGASADQPLPRTGDHGDLPKRRFDLRKLRRTILITETETHYEAEARGEPSRHAFRAARDDLRTRIEGFLRPEVVEGGASSG